MNSSVRCRLEPAAQRRVERVLVLTLAGLAALGLGLVALPGWVLGAFWLAAAGIALHELRRPVPTLLEGRTDGRFAVELEGDGALLSCVRARRYGPWLLLDCRSEDGRARAVRLLPAVLGAERQRELGRLLASLRPATPASV